MANKVNWLVASKPAQYLLACKNELNGSGGHNLTSDLLSMLREQTRFNPYVILSSLRTAE